MSIQGTLLGLPENEIGLRMLNTSIFVSKQYRFGHLDIHARTLKFVAAHRR